MLFWQVKGVGDNFSYIVADEKTRETMIVDPSYNGPQINRIIKVENLKPVYIVNTHAHRDHTQDNKELRVLHGARIIAHKSSTISMDDAVIDGDILRVGEVRVQILHTPGHSPDSICLLLDNKVLTGDTLFVGECGRTDLGGGDPEKMYHSLFGKLMKLPDSTEVYPGHDYGSSPSSTIGLEKTTNYVLRPRTAKEFVEFMRSP
jgi:glyoxylase-like metal-dependent hydrolase (beta-lactamase superfamily II)